MTADETDRRQRRAEPDGDEGQREEGDRKDHPRGPKEGGHQADHGMGDPPDQYVVTAAARDRRGEKAVTERDQQRYPQGHREPQPDRSAGEEGEGEEDGGGKQDRGRLPGHVEDKSREGRHFSHQPGRFPRVDTLRARPLAELSHPLSLFRSQPDTRYWLTTRSGAMCTKQPSRRPLP